MLTRSLLSCVVVASALSVEAATKVAVLEFGKGGTVRRTTTKHAETTVNGVASFWDALHRSSRPQNAGMTVVPDMFNSADSHVVIGIEGDGVDMENMPTVSKIMSGEEKPVVGHMEVSGSKCHDLMSKADDVKIVEHKDIVEEVKKSCKKPGFNGIKTTVDSKSAESTDKEVAALVRDLETYALSEGKTIVAHLVVEDKNAAISLRDFPHRRLDENVDGEGEGNGNGNGDGNGNGNGQGNSNYVGYYGYGYYNAFGEWVTPYKTMYQIQMFNVYCWTAIVLGMVLIYAVYLMVFMPLEPDTLLFGESAKMVGDE